VDLEGNEHKFFRKHFFTEKGHELLTLMMAEHDAKMNIVNAVGEFEDMPDPEAFEGDEDES